VDTKDKGKNKMEIILLLLACFGLTNILVNGKILDKFRELISKNSFLKDLIGCSMCTGWWVGLYFAIVLLLIPMGSAFYYLATLPFASSGISWILERGASILDTIAHRMDSE
jgi:hypothetical protein